ncbi:MAG: hypothetical protein PF542_07040 [Nanoarchaeota archaeon]|jgi:hypothetical protein|nr:hypothetical protein [Nanoarchaeota archaeon]
MKKTNILLLTVYCLLLTMSLVSAAGESTNICCEKTNTGAWCQNVPANQCASERAAQTSCSQTSFCQLGTCVDNNAGICIPNSPKRECEQNGGQWSLEAKSQIPMCAPGCCKIGDEVAFVSQTECKQLASDYGVNINFLKEITDEPSCLALAKPSDKGACVTYSDTGSTCTMITREACNSMSGDFNDGLLCTAPGLSDCAKSDKTTCYDDDVYFLDTCGNLANIYDERMFSSNENSWTIEMTNYWTDVKDDYSDFKAQGDCDYVSGTSCTSKRGLNFCGDLSCEYDTNNNGKIDAGEKYSHGESWCAESDGAYNHILVDPETMEFLDEKTQTDLKTEYNTYNVPGSRYYRLQCWEGETIVEPCRDYRNEVCKEANIGENNDFGIAQCRVNAWRNCLDIDTKLGCDEAYTDCKWVQGYRFDFAKAPKELIENEQGSCLPLYAPGFDFWVEGTSGEAVCSLATVSENVQYETHWLEERDDIDYDLELATENCLEDCYALPGYAKDKSISDMEKIHEGVIEPNGLVSNRLGYYCALKKDENSSRVGAVIGKVNCASSPETLFGLVGARGTEKVPLFYRNQDWLSSITERSASLGDCGYKNNFAGEKGKESTEIVTALFQKLTQQGEMKTNSTTKQIYVGDSWTDDDPRTEGLK